MREEWVKFDWGPLALHLLHQRHEAVGVESGTVELATIPVRGWTFKSIACQACR